MTREAGKGDKQRPTDHEAYSNGWDAIWGTKPSVKEQNEVIDRLTWEDDDIVAGMIDEMDDDADKDIPFVSSPALYRFYDGYFRMYGRSPSNYERKTLSSMTASMVNETLANCRLKVISPFMSLDGVMFRPRSQS